MKDIDLAWAAGFFDGEGSVIIRKVSPSQRYAVRIQVSQVNPAPIKCLQEFFGGHISYQKARKKEWNPQWKWEQDSKSSVETLKQLLPYLIVKKDVASLAIEFQQLKKKGQKTTPAVISLEEGFKAKVYALNKKD